jgi:hypothetical protein
MSVTLCKTAQKILGECDSVCKIEKILMSVSLCAKQREQVQDEGDCVRKTDREDFK